MLLAMALMAAPVLFVAPAQAQDGMVTLQSDPAKQAKEHDELFAALAAAANEAEARRVASRIWLLWFRAPNAEAKDLMISALDRRRVNDFAGAAAILDKLVMTAPDWAEVWNQRATMRYLLNDLAGSLADIDEVLKREPKHFGALSGEVLILLRQGKIEAARNVLRRAMLINPFMPERALLGESPQAEGQDI